MELHDETSRLLLFPTPRSEMETSRRSSSATGTVIPIYDPATTRSRTRTEVVSFEPVSGQRDSRRIASILFRRTSTPFIRCPIEHRRILLRMRTTTSAPWAIREHAAVHHPRSITTSQATHFLRVIPTFDHHDDNGASVSLAEIRSCASAMTILRHATALYRKRTCSRRRF